MNAFNNETKSIFNLMREMNTSYLIVMILVLLCGSLNCNSPTGPDDNSPGRRDYVWQVDTLAIPYNILRRCWGSSPSDVWAVGSGGGLDKTIYHYDGTKWTTDGISRNIAPSSIFGFGQNNVWIGGMNGDFWHYDGNRWSKFSQDSITGYSSNLYFEDLYGDSPNDIYAFGTVYKSLDSYNRKGVIFHFNGIKWTNVEIPEFPVDFYKVNKDNTKNKYYLTALRNEPMYGDTNKVYEFDGKNIREIYSAPDGQMTAATVLNIGKGVYFEFQGIIHSYERGAFIETLNLNKNTNYICARYGRNMKDIFLYMQDGVAHYNGTDIQYILNPIGPRLPIPASIFFEKDIFLMAYDYFGTGASIIFRGTLK